MAKSESPLFEPAQTTLKTQLDSSSAETRSSTGTGDVVASCGGEHFAMRLHPIHGSSWQRRSISALSRALLNAVDQSVTRRLEEADQVQGLEGLEVHINGLSVDISDPDGDIESLPLLQSEVSRGTVPRSLLLHVPVNTEDVDQEQTPVKISCTSGDYRCQSCRCGNFRGFRCYQDRASSQDPAPAQVRRLTHQQWLCPKCASQGAADTWLLIVEPHDNHAVDDESAVQFALAALAEAGAMRSDLDKVLHVSEKELARGGKAVLHCASARRNVDGEQTVVKFFNPTKPKDGVTELDIIMQELVMLASVQGHPNIVRVRGLFQARDSLHRDDSNIPWPNMAQFGLLMDFYCGGDLAHAMNQKSFSEPEGTEVIDGVLSALSHVHAREIVHRDVKCENILYAADGRPVLADFGMACRTSDVNEMSRRCGSPGFCAPEMIMGKLYDQTVDVFATGVVLYRLLQGRTPFEGRDANSVFRRTLECKIGFEQPASDDCKKFIRHLLRAKASARPTSAQALSSPFLIQARALRGPEKDPQQDDEPQSSPADQSRDATSVARESTCSSRAGYPSSTVLNDIVAGFEFPPVAPKLQPSERKSSRLFSRRVVRSPPSQQLQNRQHVADCDSSGSGDDVTKPAACHDAGYESAAAPQGADHDGHNRCPGPSAPAVRAIVMPPERRASSAPGRKPFIRRRDGFRNITDVRNGNEMEQ